MKQEMARVLIESRRFFAGFRQFAQPFCGILGLGLVSLALQYTYPADGYGRAQEAGRPREAGEDFTPGREEAQRCGGSWVFCFVC
jgi:hypothetical protein